ncbi:hypothetical protein [Pseudophaeobacter leonis]|uniref:hypothetical protein n=1 Tax=Pseudophaeobacter leonis TaxID=1144477 RepID=UPI0009F51938|nr:hypothetical protein [Pseudophaeobacter leonis]
MCSFIPRPLAELQEFARFHYEPLQNAALLLAGPFALKRVQTLLDDVLSSATITRRLQVGVVDVHKLLSLYHVNNPDRIEAAYFAEIDMCDPFIEDICLMTEALTDILYRLDLDPGQPLADYLIAA